MNKRWLTLACMTLLTSGAAFAADGGKPQYGDWGFDLAGANNAIAPGDDFFRYANVN